MPDHRKSGPQDEGALTISVATTGPDSATATLTGRLDAVSAPALGAEFQRLGGTGVQHLLIDLARVRFIDSAGLATLVRARRDLQSRNGDVVLVSPISEAAMRVFRLTQFDQVFRMIAAQEMHKIRGTG